MLPPAHCEECTKVHILDPANEAPWSIFLELDGQAPVDGWSGYRGAVPLSELVAALDERGLAGAGRRRVRRMVVAALEASRAEWNEKVEQRAKSRERERESQAGKR